MKCTCCSKTDLKDNKELARHILDTEDSPHSKARVWALRYLGLKNYSRARVPMSRGYPLEKKVQVDKNGEPICSICRLPIGKQDQQHCNC